MKFRSTSLILLLLVQATSAQNISINLNSNWQFRNQAKGKWYKATVPGTIHTDLLANKLIPDPYYRDNESKLQWIDKDNWEYKTAFNVDAKTFSKKNIELVFDGLDTYADVYLNNKLILRADNMFRGWTIDVKPILKRSNNQLLIRFSSAQNKVDSIARSGLPLVLPDNNRIYVRKAQYHFGWDWGPKFVGCGIWRKIKLEGWDYVKIGMFKPLYFEATQKSLFEYKIRTADGYAYYLYLIDKEMALKKKINYRDISLLYNHDIVLSSNSTYTDFNADSLWLNKKTRKATAVLFHQQHNGPIKFAEERDIFFGLNQTRLIQQKDDIGTSFYFEKEGKPIYAKGANWIPSDVFLPRLKKQDYRKILKSAKDANMNMLRVWGGGVYEADEFYDLCDEMGIMVWQDFMFAGGMVPGDDVFFNNVREEVKYQLERLKHHPCIVLWCGNNEIDEAWNNWGWQRQFNLHGADSIKVWTDYKRMFRDSLPKWVNEFDGTRPYISTSPMHGWGRKESLTEGDSHYWGLWWGLEDWETFENKTGRFVSEYGMQAMPNMNTIKSFTTASDRNLNSTAIKAHQKATNGFKKIDHYLTRYFIDSTKLKKLLLEDYTYLTQCMQYYILKNSIAIHRSKYPRNMGTLLWQLNDCWPVASWSITDYSREPKAAWYAVREAYRDDVIPLKDSLYPKDLELQKPEFTIKAAGESCFIIQSNVDAQYVYLYKINKEFEVSSNYFNLKAGEKKKLAVKRRYFSSKEISEIKIKSLYDVIKN